MSRIFFFIVTFIFSASAYSQNEDRPENTGDNFSLEGALSLFKKSTSLENFEQQLNEEDNHVNNLDLNNDGQVDYIFVNDLQEGDAHAIVLSIMLKENEQQDVAIIGIEKMGTESARLQIEGDTDLFPENTIIEPADDGASFMLQEEYYDTYASLATHKKMHGPFVYIDADGRFELQHQVFVNVWFWPGVRFIYAPGYVVWRSPWRWGLYPKWWRPWSPRGFSVFYGRCATYRVHFHRVPTRSVPAARGIYAPRRSRSSFVIHNNRRSTTIIKTNPRGRVKAVKVKRGRGRRP
jgi:hypothetical protein